MSLWHALENVTPPGWDIETGNDDEWARARSPNGQYEWYLRRWTDSSGELWEVQGRAVKPSTGRMVTVLDFKEASQHDATSTVGAFTSDLVGRSSEEPPSPGLFDQLG